MGQGGGHAGQTDEDNRAGVQGSRPNRKDPKQVGDSKFLKKHSLKGRVKVQTRNFMGLGEGKRATEIAGGLEGIGASGRTWQQARVKKKVTFFWSKLQSEEKRAKKVSFHASA